MRHKYLIKRSLYLLLNQKVFTDSSIHSKTVAMYFYFAWKMPVNAIPGKQAGSASAAVIMAWILEFCCLAVKSQPFLSKWNMSRQLLILCRIQPVAVISSFTRCVDSFGCGTHTTRWLSGSVGILFDQIAFLDKWVRLCHSRHSPTWLHSALSNTAPIWSWGFALCSFCHLNS